ncbi:MAG: hypothetical protein ATN35_00285 [Epulopiscium sp. Nele67-Bin004]|nr:MAG: hypothetical protein ATN35_00285 [Epulopiscium sp. Nele67-Bin004]
MDTVFVYGSLRQGMHNHDAYLKGKIKRSIKGAIKGQLYHLSNKGYPAVVEGDDYIVGELVELKDVNETLNYLDDLEQYISNDINNSEYCRKIVDVKLDDNTIKTAYFYEYNLNSNFNKQDVRIPVKSGDWKKYIQNKTI